MNKIWIILLLLHLNIVWGPGQNCFSQFRQQEILATQPDYVKKLAEIEAFTREWISRREYGEKSLRSYQIPVVVHVVWHQNEENISEDQILSQIDVLNEDFQALNASMDLVPPVFRLLIANVELSFCLAGEDPLGQISNGITRTQTQYANVGTAQDEQGRFRIFYSDAGGQDAWDPTQYLNIWVARRGYGSGSAAFPGMTPPEEDGLVIDFRYFGTTGAAASNQPYHLGRTVTHEVGHYFNLLHPWGRGSDPDCESDDEVEDTPRQATTYLHQCPTNEIATCDTPDFFFNYMNYTDDACMAMFTVGQKMRMLAALEGPRSGLIAPLPCREMSATGNPPKNPLKIWHDVESGEWWVQVEYGNSGQLSSQLFNLLGQPLWSDRRQVFGRQNLPIPLTSPGVYLLHIHWQGRTYIHKTIFP